MQSKIPEQFWNRKSQQVPYYHSITGFRIPTKFEQEQTVKRKENKL